MKTITRIFSILLFLATATGLIFLLVKLFSNDEDDPYYFYGDSMYRGDDGDPIQYESDEEKETRLKPKEEQVIPDGYSHMVN